MINELKIPRHDLELIQKELEANRPHEACGVLIGMTSGSTAIVEKARPIKNVQRSNISFELDPKEFFDAWDNATRKGKEIVGVYHTHPRAPSKPSQWDRKTMENFSFVWLIAGADGMRAYVWDDGVKAVKVTSSPF